MSLLDRLERKFGRYAIKGLPMHIVALNMLVYLLNWVQLTYTERSLIPYLVLEPSLILKGEVWRLVSYIFIPPMTSILWILFTLYFYYIVGTGLEHEWGSFKFNIYYFIGMIGTTVFAFITQTSATAVYLNLSVLLAFAYLFPNFGFNLFMFIPIKVKYLGWLAWIGIGYSVLSLPLEQKLYPIIPVLNFFLFFGKDIFIRYKTRGHSIYRKSKYQLSSREKPYMHKCTVCGITDKDDYKMEFRYCTTCEGDYEYCMEHLKNHEHIKAKG